MQLLLLAATRSGSLSLGYKGQTRIDLPVANNGVPGIPGYSIGLHPACYIRLFSQRDNTAWRCQRRGTRARAVGDSAHFRTSAAVETGTSAMVITVTFARWQCCGCEARNKSLGTSTEQAGGNIECDSALPHSSRRLQSRMHTDLPTYLADKAERQCNRANFYRDRRSRLPQPRDPGHSGLTLPEALGDSRCHSTLARNGFVTRLSGSVTSAWQLSGRSRCGLSQPVTQRTRIRRHFPMIAVPSSQQTRFACVPEKKKAPCSPLLLLPLSWPLLALPWRCRPLCPWPCSSLSIPHQVAGLRMAPLPRTRFSNFEFISPSRTWPSSRKWL
ncbi:hypothetical protein F5Y15DRAFT_42368 [Xylariaceae sp. FL0016]|nr:hypothetical protein F5Y15DRAFT_42368 [Xylariaceae sp. FL0016]